MIRHSTVTLAAACAIFLGACSASSPERPSASADAITSDYSHERVIQALARATDRPCRRHRPTGSWVPRTVCETRIEQALQQETHTRIVDESVRPMY